MNSFACFDMIITVCNPGKLRFPAAPDLNTRLRRLVATFQRNHKREQMKVAKKERVSRDDVNYMNCYCL